MICFPFSALDEHQQRTKHAAIKMYTKLKNWALFVMSIETEVAPIMSIAIAICHWKINLMVNTVWEIRNKTEQGAIGGPFVPAEHYHSFINFNRFPKLKK